MQQRPRTSALHDAASRRRRRGACEFGATRVEKTKRCTHLEGCGLPTRSLADARTLALLAVAVLLLSVVRRLCVAVLLLAASCCPALLLLLLVLLVVAAGRIAAAGDRNGEFR